ncbi:MAG TPA: SCO6880 family protein [Acidimicrobiales bacterium]|nr:SCO6880 family protein [Acidimicrobiales bacterium]
MAEARRYHFAPAEQRVVVLGLSAAQVASLAFGLVASVLALRAVHGPAGAGLALLLMAAGAAGAVVPVRSRLAVTWFPVVAARAATVARGAHRWRSPAPTAGLPGRRPSASATSSRSGGVALRREVMPPHLAGCRITEAADDADGRCLGVVHDPRGGSLVAAVAVSGRGFYLADAADRDRSVAGWAAVLAGLAREESPVHRVQWVLRTSPAPRPTGPAVPLPVPSDDRPAPDGTEPGPSAAGYSELLEAAPAVPVHEVVVALAVDLRRLRRGAAPEGGTSATRGTSVLRREVATLEAALRGAGLDVAGPLGPKALRRALGCDGPGLPVAVDAGWDRVRADDRWHSTYWIAEWPRAEVGADFLSPLLLLGGGVQSVAVTMEPISPMRAVRQAEAARTAGTADEELRRRGGFLPTARRRRAHEGVAEREAELADGHADFRFSGYVTVSAATSPALDEACAEVEQVAAQCRLLLRRLYGEQQAALAFTLPLCRGLS